MSIRKSAHQHIYLIGMMGSGKSFWGKWIAGKNNLPFYDLDTVIEDSVHLSIQEIFALHGEDYFRVKEKETVALTALYAPSVIATGGGTPCFYNNMEVMNRQGITIWIDEDIDTLTERLKKEKDKRPLIRELSDDGLKQFLENKLSERYRFYNQSAYHLKGGNITEDNFAKIISAL